LPHESLHFNQVKAYAHDRHLKVPKQAMHSNEALDEKENAAPKKAEIECKTKSSQENRDRTWETLRSLLILMTTIRPMAKDMQYACIVYKSATFMSILCSKAWQLNVLFQANTMKEPERSHERT